MLQFCEVGSQTPTVLHKLDLMIALIPSPLLVDGDPKDAKSPRPPLIAPTKKNNRDHRTAAMDVAATQA
jgi:hypothetical protein